MRADARRNRAKVLAAAEEVVAERGTAVSTEEIARRAGVGIGTLFRHFPTKESLLEAILVGMLRRLAEEARALAASNDDRGADPGAAFFGFFRRVVAEAGTKRAVTAALAEAGVDARTAAAQVGQDLWAALGALLGKAQRAGAVRADVGSGEIIALMIATSHAVEQAGGDAEIGAKTLDVVLDGLRPGPRATAAS
jgi:AcrR family transcriptional regulator